MSKIIPLRVNAQEEEFIDNLKLRLGISNTSGLFKEALKRMATEEKRVILPKNIVSKDDMAKFIGIGKLEKEYSLFEDRIYEARVYDPDRVRGHMM